MYPPVLPLVEYPRAGVDLALRAVHLRGYTHWVNEAATDNDT